MTLKWPVLQKTGEHSKALTSRAFFLLNIVIGIFSMLAFGDQLHWLLFLCCQFRLQFLWLGLVCAVGLLFSRRYKSLSACLVVAVFNWVGMEASCFYTQNAELSSGKQPLDSSVRLLEMNVENKNHDYERARRFISEAAPDIILIDELTPTWLAELKPVFEKHKFQVLETRDDTYGTGVFSRFPILYSKIEYFGERKHPVIRIDFKRASKTVNLVHAHFQGPVSPRYYAMHLADVQGTLNMLNDCGATALLCGDLNTNSWCHPLRGLVKSAGLMDSRRGRGFQLSWPTTNRSPIPLLGIDHCFVRGLQVTERSVGAAFGSDHFPILVDMSLKNEP